MGSGAIAVGSGAIAVGSGAIAVGAAVAGGATAAVVAVAGGAEVAVGWLVQAIARLARAMVSNTTQDWSRLSTIINPPQYNLTFLYVADNHTINAFCWIYNIRQIISVFENVLI
ncbi:MAG: hypothetical protein BZY73_01980 [SAR202 cluster bacterium Casp-Chloro-G3]|nr:MAG: hypothetical protein BZY73_01980 [SAR202 cluster bacterium Casp-Chloro-G3]